MSPIPRIILKGQGVATLYDAPLHRLSGDIDIWVSGTKEEILDHVRKYKEPDEVEYHHVDFNILDNVEIEVHFFPTFSFNPVANLRVKRWIRTLKMEDVTRMTEMPEGAGTIPMPTHELFRCLRMNSMPCISCNMPCAISSMVEWGCAMFSTIIMC